MEQQGDLDAANPVDIYTLHLVYLPVINHGIDLFAGGWNRHTLRTLRSSPHAVMLSGLLETNPAQRGADLLDLPDPDQYGVDHGGPIPEPDDHTVSSFSPSFLFVDLFCIPLLSTSFVGMWPAPFPRSVSLLAYSQYHLAVIHCHTSSPCHCDCLSLFLSPCALLTTLQLPFLALAHQMITSVCAACALLFSCVPLSFLLPVCVAGLCRLHRFRSLTVTPWLARTLMCCMHHLLLSQVYLDPLKRLLSDAEEQYVKNTLDFSRAYGRDHVHFYREVLDLVHSILDTGLLPCVWLPCACCFQCLTYELGVHIHRRADSGPVIVPESPNRVAHSPSIHLCSPSLRFRTPTGAAR